MTTARKRCAAPRRTNGALYSGAALEVGVDKNVDVAVEDAFHVAGLHAGAQVLNHLIGVEDVRADLGPEADVRFLAALLLTALVLTLRDDSRRQVRNTNRRVCLVDVLSAGSRGPVRVDLKVLLVYIHGDCFVYDR